MKVVFLTILSLLLTTTQAFNPGLTASIDWKMMEQAKDAFLPYILNALNNADIPDIPFYNGVGYARNNSFQVNDPSANVSLRPVTADGSIEFSIVNLTANFGSNDLYYHKWFIITANGSMNVEISELSLYIRIKLAEKILKDGTQVPTIEVIESRLNIPSDRLNVTMQGNSLMKCVADVEFAFNGEYREIINFAVTKGIKALLPPIFDQIVQKQDGNSVLHPGVSLDWQISKAPIVTQKSIEFGMKGLFFPTKTGESGAPPSPPSMPYHDKFSASKFQLFFSTYVINSFTQTLIDNSQLQFTINSDIVPQSSPIKLDTTYLDTIFPGIVDAYGKDRPVDVEFSIKRSEVLTIGNKERIKYSCDTGVKFWVETVNGTKLLAVDLTINQLLLDLQIMIFDNSPWVEAKQIQLGSIVQQQSNIWQKLNLTEQTENINNFFVEGLPIFNYWFKVQHFKIPDTLFGLFKLSDAKISYFDGFIEAAFTPTFIAPESAFIKPLRSTVPTFYKYEESIDYNGVYSFKTINDDLEQKFMQ